MNLNHIFHISRYEFKMLRRDRGMHVVILLISASIVFFHLAVQSNLVRPDWVTISLPSSIPFANAWLSNYLLLFVTLFWGGRFMQYRRPSDSNEAISVRPFSNPDYLYGKNLAFIALAFLLACIWCLLAVLIHLTVTDSPFAFLPYFFYLFTLTFPSLIFTTGLVIVLKGCIRRRALQLLVIPGLFFLIFAFGTDRFYHITDIFAFSLPNQFSDVTGFSGVYPYVLHRLTVLLTGISFMIFGIYEIKRLSHAGRFRNSYLLAALLILSAGVFTAGEYISYFTAKNQKRIEVRNALSDFQNRPMARISEHDILFRQQKDSCDISSRLVLYNPSDSLLSSVVLFLNPGLTLNSVTTEGQLIPYKRRQQVIVLDCSLEAGQKLPITLCYHGKIIPEVCYPEIEDLQEMTAIQEHYIFRQGTEYAYLTPDFTLLTPECLWYPVALPPVNIEAPYLTQQSYTHFTLTVVGEEKRTPISQGQKKVTGDTTRFENDRPLTGISLCIGDYNCLAYTSTDSVRYELYLFKGHDYLTEGFDDPQKVIDLWQWRFIPGVEAYTYRKLALVETPIHFRAHSRFWKTGSEYIQPELIFRPEREAFAAFAFKIKPPSLRPGYLEIDPLESCIMSYLNNEYGVIRHYGKKHLVARLFHHLPKIGPLKNEYNLSLLLQPNHCFFFSSEFPGIDLLFWEIQNSRNTAFQGFRDGYTPVDAIEYLNRHSFQQVFTDTLSPDKTERIIHLVGETVLKHLLAIVPYETWDRFNNNFLKNHSDEEIRFETYAQEFQQLTGFDLLTVVRHYYNVSSLPAFFVDQPHIREVDDREEEKSYMQSVKVWNKGKTDGVVSIAGSRIRPNLHYIIPAGACREIRHYFSGEVEEFNTEIQTNLAQNIPAYFSFDDVVPEKPGKALEAGVYDADTTVFQAPPDEYIVDDADSGFQIIETTKKLRKEFSDKNQWTRDYHAEAYGKIVKSYWSKKAGSGASQVSWNTHLNHSGDYEIFIYLDAFSIRSGASITYIKDGKVIAAKEPRQTYIFSHAEGEEEITLETLYEPNGWISLGTYPFSAGPARIILTDQGADLLHSIFADAVKWVRQR